MNNHSGMISLQNPFPKRQKVIGQCEKLECNVGSPHHWIQNCQEALMIDLNFWANHVA